MGNGKTCLSECTIVNALSSSPHAAVLQDSWDPCVYFKVHQSAFKEAEPLGDLMDIQTDRPADG